MHHSMRQHKHGFLSMLVPRLKAIETLYEHGNKMFRIWRQRCCDHANQSHIDVYAPVIRFYLNKLLY